MRTVLLYIIFVLILAACSSPKYEETQPSSDPSKRTIVIALVKGSQSDFKTSLIDSIKADFGRNYNIEIVSANNYHDVANRDYAALIVMERLKAWLVFNGGLKNIIKNADLTKTIFLVTSGNPHWEWHKANLALITAASQKSILSEVYQKLKTQINLTLSRN